MIFKYGVSKVISVEILNRVMARERLPFHLHWDKEYRNDLLNEGYVSIEQLYINIDLRHLAWKQIYYNEDLESQMLELMREVELLSEEGIWI